ncbi:mannosyltransferase [Emydomyces testavorans]|uniref:Mannosyltransferase n=1 Tax=Emydomyces testavorans TaxID=2070801 RepID=A0AAF0DS11_9EURO|nr:mannosyltransferase [Emydomyces testavorans]
MTRYHSRFPARLKSLVVLFVFVALIIYLPSKWRPLTSLDDFESQKVITSKDNYEEHAKFWRSFHPILVANAPNCTSPERLRNADSTRFDPKNEVERPDLMWMPEEDVEKMKMMHNSFLNTLSDRPLQPYFVPGTRGLVSTAGGSFLPILTISLRMLRHYGSALPMEVFLASKEEYEPYICEHVFAELNAKCVILEEILNEVPGPVDIKQYQYKPFAMLFSSFEEMLFLDADAFPLHDPKSLFTSEPFRSVNMVTWPDFWASSASPLYYKIASQPIPPTTDRASTESGELLISKRTHQKTLMLATYYNYYGPDYYYPLFSQGAAGEGDKETFIAAATAVNEPFYQVSEPLEAIGHRAADGGMDGSAMVQYDPVEDYRLARKGIFHVPSLSAASSPKPFFIHANFPKFNPATIFEKHATDPVRDPQGRYIRQWTIPEDTIEEFEEDVVKQFWSEIKWVACKLEGKFESWKNKTGICDGVKRYWNVVFEKKS